MKKLFLIFVSAAGILSACQKSSSLNSVSLSASTTTASVGQTVVVTASTTENSIDWSVTPATGSVQTYDVTTEKINYYTFTQAGVYTVGVRVRHLDLDSVHTCNHADSTGHHLQDSVWNHHIDSLWHGRGLHHGDCHLGQDSASITIKVN